MRVQFVLNLYQLTRSSGRYDGKFPEGRGQMIDWMAATLELRQEDTVRLHRGENARIDCTAEQFVRFLMERCRRGYITLFRDLQAKVITDPPYTDQNYPLFVSQNTQEDLFEEWTDISEKFDVSIVSGKVQIRRR
jgi:hypothetical protein